MAIGRRTQNFIDQHPSLGKVEPCLVDDVVRSRILSFTNRFIASTASGQSSLRRHDILVASNIEEPRYIGDSFRDLLVLQMNMREQIYTRLLQSLAWDIANGVSTSRPSVPSTSH